MYSALGGRHSDFGINAVDSRLSSLGLGSGQEHCVVLLGKTLNSYSTSVHPGVLMGTGKFNAGGNSVMD